MKSRIIRWARDVALTEVRGVSYTVLVRKFEGKSSLGRCTCR